MDDWINVFFILVIVLIPMMLLVSKLYKKEGEETLSITKYYGGIMALIASICIATFSIALRTIPIWGGAMILYWIFS
ncbi:hypothetical protein [Marinomonas flavescens]|uniref:hypothetical protein n=1 Tax=Marinomonas flavescens TaxID=2529379 RepID=UPI001054C7CF|nr:hypothetical protein [Marinomonas flavescens]